MLNKYCTCHYANYYTGTLVNNFVIIVQFSKGAQYPPQRPIQQHGQNFWTIGDCFNVPNDGNFGSKQGIQSSFSTNTVSNHSHGVPARLALKLRATLINELLACCGRIYYHRNGRIL